VQILQDLNWAHLVVKKDVTAAHYMANIAIQVNGEKGLKMCYCLGAIRNHVADKTRS
jgi:hypothetical protein